MGVYLLRFIACSAVCWCLASLGGCSHCNDCCAPCAPCVECCPPCGACTSCCPKPCCPSGPTCKCSGGTHRCDCKCCFCFAKPHCCCGNTFGRGYCCPEAHPPLQPFQLPAPGQPPAPAPRKVPTVEESRTLKPMPKPPELKSPPAPSGPALPPMPPAPGAEVPRESKPELKITKIGPARRHVGKTVEHEIEVHNDGPVAANDVKVVDILPPELKLETPPDDATVDGQEVTWKLGTLAANETRKVTIRTQALQVSPRINNRATVTSTEGSGATATAAMEIVATPGVTMEVYDLQDPVVAGQETEYILRVVNQGPTALLGLRLNADCPEELKPVGMTGAGNDAIQGQGARIPQFDLRAGETKAFRLKVQALKAADARFKASLTGDDLDSPLNEEESTTVYESNSAVERASLSPPK